jgi:hypothetical protein
VAFEISTPILVGLASGSVLFIYFVSFDRPGVLAVAAVIGYWVLFACTYLILGRPGRDWWLPVDVRALAVTVEAMSRTGLGYARRNARGGLAVLVAGARTAAREARPTLAALAALAAARPPPGSPAVARSGDSPEAGAGAACSSDQVAP